MTKHIGPYLVESYNGKLLHISDDPESGVQYTRCGRKINGRVYDDMPAYLAQPGEDYCGGKPCTKCGRRSDFEAINTTRRLEQIKEREEHKAKITEMTESWEKRNTMRPQVFEDFCSHIAGATITKNDNIRSEAETLVTVDGETFVVKIQMFTNRPTIPIETHQNP